MLSDPGRWGDEGKFDPATVVGLRNYHRVLVIGNPAFLPWLTRESLNITAGKKPNEVFRQLDPHGYDRVVVGRENETPLQLILAQAAVALAPTQGVLVMFPTNETDAWELRNNVEFFYPGSEIWENDSTFGRVVQIRLAPSYNV
jgi:hypothetical protein